jgi:hypothetical protein
MNLVKAFTQAISNHNEMEEFSDNLVLIDLANRILQWESHDFNVEDFNIFDTEDGEYSFKEMVHHAGYKIDDEELLDSSPAEWLTSTFKDRSDSASITDSEVPIRLVEVKGHSVDMVLFEDILNGTILYISSKSCGIVIQGPLVQE